MTTTRKFRHPLTLATCSVSYNDRTRVTVVRRPAGEEANDVPEVYRPKTAQEAAGVLGRVFGDLKARGYYPAR